MAATARPTPAIRVIPKPAAQLAFLAEHVTSVEKGDGNVPWVAIRFNVGPTGFVVEAPYFPQALAEAMELHAAETEKLARAPLALVSSPKHVCEWCSRAIASSEPYVVLGGAPLHVAKCLDEFDSVVAGAEAGR